MTAHIPYRITIELATDEKGKTITLTGGVPDHRMTTGMAVAPHDLCLLASEALNQHVYGLRDAAASQALAYRYQDAWQSPTNQVPY